MIANAWLSSKQYTDGSSIGIGGVLIQMVDNVEHPIGYFSRMLTRAERNYSIFEIETLAALESVIYFKDLLEDIKFTIYLDKIQHLASFYHARIWRVG